MKKEYIFTDREVEGALTYIGNLYQEVVLQCEEEPLMTVQKDLQETIDEIMHTFTGRQLQILLNDILLPIEKEWWKVFYTKRVYDENKKVVMKKFFDCLNR